MFKSKWSLCLQRIEHWTNNMILLRTDVKTLEKGHADMRTIYTSHHATIEQLSQRVAYLEGSCKRLHAKNHALEIKLASSDRTIIHKYENAPKRRKEVSQ